MIISAETAEEIEDEELRRKLFSLRDRLNWIQVPPDLEEELRRYLATRDLSSP